MHFLRRMLLKGYFLAKLRGTFHEIHVGRSRQQTEVSEVYGKDAEHVVLRRLPEAQTQGRVFSVGKWKEDNNQQEHSKVRRMLATRCRR